MPKTKKSKSKAKPQRERWYKPTTNTGWKKNMPVVKRRKMVLDAHGRDTLSAARGMQALANVTTDKVTKKQARADAMFFYNKYKNEAKS